jgi:hypothetical protein
MHGIVFALYRHTPLNHLKSKRMKKLFICAAIVFVGAFLTDASAQSTKSNKDLQPKWAQSGDDYIEYLYLPEISTYYYVPRKQFIYQSNGYWSFSSSLPEAHRGFNLHEANKVVINEPGAYRYFADHKQKYSAKNGAVAVD